MISSKTSAFTPNTMEQNKRFRLCCSKHWKTTSGKLNGNMSFQEQCPSSCDLAVNNFHRDYFFSRKYFQ